MSGDAQMILGDWLSLCNLSITCKRGDQDGKAHLLMAGALVHMLPMHMYARGCTYTCTLINKCMKKWANCHTIARWRAPLSDTRRHSGFSHLPNVNSATPSWQHQRTEEGHTERDMQKKEGVCVCIYRECVRERERGKRCCHVLSHMFTPRIAERHGRLAASDLC